LSKQKPLSWSSSIFSPAGAKSPYTVSGLDTPDD
jgi:hypothetical protein